MENLKRSARFPGWNFRTECRVPCLYQFQVRGRAPRRTGVYDQMEQLFTKKKFHFCSHRISGFFPKWKAAPFSTRLAAMLQTKLQAIVARFNL